MATKAITQRATYTAGDIAEYLGISRTGAYNLMHAKNFPSFKVGMRLLVKQEAFERWVAQRENEPTPFKSSK